MDDPPDRANHPGRSGARERFEQPQLPGMEAVTGHADFVDQKYGWGDYGMGRWRSTNIPMRDVTSWRQPDPPEALKMFSSAREIMATYKPLEGDREEVSHDYDWDNPSSSEQTWRSKNSNYYRNPKNPNWSGNALPETPQGSERQTDDAGNKQYIRSHQGEMETDEQLWSRKGEEAFDPEGRQGAFGGYSGAEPRDPHTTMRSMDTQGNTLEESEQTVTDQTWDDSAGDWKTAHRPMHRHPGREGKFGGYDSLGDALQNKGYDWSRHPEGVGEGRFKFPVSVQFQGTAGPEGPMVLGGHHRVAAMNQINPDTPVPIEYFDNFWHAKRTGHYT